MPLPHSPSPLPTLLLTLLFTFCLFPSTFITLIHLPFSPLLPSPTTDPPPSTPSPTMSFSQTTFTLPARTRGSHLITPQVLAAVPAIRDVRAGLLHLFVQHTSCALALNENWDADVRVDMSAALDRLVPEDQGQGLYRHSAEGKDDMPAHVKAALVGASVTVPITDGELAMGTWQGIWYLEFRDGKHARKVVATVQGERK